MATASASVACALLAILLWMPVGWLIARRLPLASDLRVASAPILGWAMQSVVALQVSMWAGFATLTVLAATALVGFAAIPAPSPDVEPLPAPAVPVWALAAAALVAVGPALSVLPKVTPDGVVLASPIYDHAKIALVDEIVRSGVPPANPFLGGGREPGTVAYYYFWLFGAAELALISGASGWEADIAATWFIAFASLALMCGLAFRLSGASPASIAFVLIAALAGSLRPLLSTLIGQERTNAILEPATGFAGWFFQTSWSPHHVAAGTAVVVALLLMERLARRPTLELTLVLAILAAAGFGSSLWVGGITFGLCAGVAGLVLFISVKPEQRWPFLIAVAVASWITVALVSPLLFEQIRFAAEGSDAIPVVIAPYPVLGPSIPQNIRRLLDLPAYWLVLLAVEFPAVWLLGAVALFRLKDLLVSALAAPTFASLCAGGLLVSTVGENNDLGWRAILPGVIILTAFAAAYVARGLAHRRVSIVTAAVVLLGLALPDGLGLLRSNATGRLSPDAARFRDAPVLWAAVRQQTGPEERIASNPRMTNTLAPWPISLSWALLANRRSCFAGNELTLAFTPLSPTARAAASALFDRVFAGSASNADLATLVRDFQCRIIVLTPEDGAWSRDPFANNATFSRVANAEGQWRIYRATPSVSLLPDHRTMLTSVRSSTGWTNIHSMKRPRAVGGSGAKLWRFHPTGSP